MDRIVVTRATDLLPMILLVGAVVLGVLALGGGRMAARTTRAPFFTFLAAALFLAWLSLAF